LAIPLEAIERQLEGVAPAATPSERLPWPDEDSSTPSIPPPSETPEAQFGPRGRAEGERSWDYFSATQLGTFMRCPETYRRRYVLGEKERPGQALLWGSVDHKGAEHNLRQKIESERDLPESDVLDFFDHAWREKLDEEGGEGEIVWDDKPGAVKTTAAKLVGLRHREVMPLIQPLKVEAEFMLDLPGVRLPIKGFIDAELDSHVVDWKTTKRAEALSRKPDWRLQMLLYAVQTGKPVHVVQSVKTQTPKVDTSKASVSAPTKHGAEVVARIVKNAIDQIDYFLATFGTHQPWPTQTPGYGHACSWCGYRPTCFYWGN
jgi:hypothetical protein